MDGFGRRVYREEAYWQNRNHLKTEITHYLWDGLHVLMEFDGKGVSPLAEYYLGNGQILAKKMFGYHGRKEPENEELIRTRGGLLYYHYDRLGTVMALTDRQGQMIDRYYYDVFGQPLAGTFGPYNRYGLTGKEYDPKTGQYYFGARWLEPELGRWMTQDSYRGIIIEPENLHRYSYVRNNPLTYIDFLGYEAGIASIFSGNLVIGFVGIQVGISVVGASEDDSDNSDVHIQLTFGAGPALGAGVSFSAGGGVSNADNGEALTGFGLSLGGSAGAGVALGGEYSPSPDTGTHTGSFSIGTGVGVEVHAYLTFTLDLFSIDITKAVEEGGSECR